MALQFGVFDHIEPVPNMGLQETYNLRMEQIEVLDKAGYHAYHLAEHHTPAVVPGRSFPAHQQHPVRTGHLRTAPPPPRATHRGVLHVGPSERRAVGDRRGAGGCF